MDLIKIEFPLTPKQEQALVLLQDKGWTRGEIFSTLEELCGKWLDARYNEIMEDKT